MFVAPANLPGITIVPLDLFVPEVFGVISGPTIDYADGDKNSVFFDEVKIHESHLIGGERDGWSVTNATLDVEHGGGAARVPHENTIVEKFLAQCRSNPNVAKRLRENPHLLASVVDIYIGAQIGRLWGLRGAGGVGAHYQGPQIMSYSKMYGARVIADMAKVLGPYALTDDDEWGLDEGIFEVGQRGGLCLAPGGTPEATKIIMSRLLGIGR
jgi:alkylation response protein AidB-like acyl-CoA dehydrogenase